MRTCEIEGCAKPHRARGMCSGHYNMTRYTAAERHPRRPTECAACGKMIEKTARSKSRRAVCSYECRWFFQDGPKSCELPVTHPAHPDCPPTGKSLVLYVAPQRTKQPPRTRWVAGRCKICRSPFVDVWLAEQSAVYCSFRCGKKAARMRRRALKRNAYVADVSPQKIYERDGWRCQICKRKVRRDKVVPHPLAPTIDHIIPLAAGVDNGGVHEPANAQCAHYICNSIKRDRITDVQLALFG